MGDLCSRLRMTSDARWTVVIARYRKSQSGLESSFDLLAWDELHSWSALGVGGNEVMNDDRDTASIALALRIVSYQTIFPLSLQGLFFLTVQRSYM